MTGKLSLAIVAVVMFVMAVAGVAALARGAYSRVGTPGVFVSGALLPGMRPATRFRRDLQKGLAGGAMVFMVPTVDSVEEAKTSSTWSTFRRSVTARTGRARPRRST